MKNIRFCYLKILCFLEVKFYIYLNRCVLVMKYRTLSFLKTATATIERVKNAGPGSDYIPLNCTKAVPYWKRWFQRVDFSVAIYHLELPGLSPTVKCPLRL